MHHVNFSPHVTGHKHEALYIHRKTYYYVRGGVQWFNRGHRPTTTSDLLVYTSTFIYIAFKRIVLTLHGVIQRSNHLQALLEKECLSSEYIDFAINHSFNRCEL